MPRLALRAERLFYAFATFTLRWRVILPRERSMFYAA